MTVMLTLGVAVQHHGHIEGSPLDYLGIGAAAAASWAGVPGPGEPVLIAAAVLAARNRLDIALVIAVAFLGALIGGVGGWFVGLKGGRRVLTRRGPLHEMRLRALERGERIFARYTAIAVIIAPTWAAGIHGVRAKVYLPWNAVGAALWATGIGLGAYFIGPPLVDLVSDDLGWVSVSVVVALVLVFVVAELRRHHRRPPER
jgi:membrane protein DedA with SNARE-associated domain